MHKPHETRRAVNEAARQGHDEAGRVRNPLPAKYKDHQLTGNLHDFRECHIEPDWLLLYHIF